jgi:hypothetical protein
MDEWARLQANAAWRRVGERLTLLPSLSQELPRERVFFAANQALPLGSAIPRIVIVSPVLVGLGACRPVLTARGAE